MSQQDQQREREYHRIALQVLARGSEQRVPLAVGTSPIPVVLFVRTFTLCFAC